MHVLVTGGAGFIGSHLVEMHLSMGDKVHVVDDLSTGSMRNLANHVGNPAFHFDEDDLLVWDGLSSAVAWADRIYHMAAVVGVYRVLEDPIRVLATNVAGCERLLRAVVAHEWKPQVIIASSSEVYGHNDESVLREEMDMRLKSGAGSRWNYAVSKLADESLGLSYARQHGIPIVIVRLFNTIGPCQTGRYGMVVPRFVRQAILGEALTVYGDGTQTRAFCDVRDTVLALHQLASSAASQGLIVNVGNKREISILDLARLIIARAKSDSSLSFIPYAKAYGEEFEDIPRRCPALERLHALTGFRHKFVLEDTIDYLITEARTSLLKAG